MTRVEIANDGHAVRLECEGTGNSVLKLAVQLWHETRECPCTQGQDSNWIVQYADTGEPG